MSKEDLEGLLLEACYAGDYSKAKDVIERGAKVDIGDECCYTPLMLALAAGSIDIAKLIISVKPDLNLQDTEMNGETALMQAVRNDNLRAVSFLLDHGADLDFEDNYGYTALDSVKSTEMREFLNMAKCVKEQNHLASQIDRQLIEQQRIEF